MLTSFMVGFFVSLFATDQSIASVRGATIVRCGSEPYVWRPVKGKVAPLPRAALRAWPWLLCPLRTTRTWLRPIWFALEAMGAFGLLTLLCFAARGQPVEVPRNAPEQH